MLIDLSGLEMFWFSPPAMLDVTQENADGGYTYLTDFFSRNFAANSKAHYVSGAIG